MTRFVVAVLAVIAAQCVAVADSPTVVRVVTGDGKPVAGAKVWVYEYTSEPPKEPTPLVTDADGKLTLPAADAGKFRQMFVRDAAGRVGEGRVNAPWYEPADPKGIEVVLVEMETRTGRVTGPDGKPVAGATVTPEGYNTQERTRRVARAPSASIHMPKWEQDRLAVKTAADGTFQFPVPTGYSVYYRVSADGFGGSKWTAPPGGDLDTPLAVPGRVTLTVTGIDPALLKGRSWRLQGVENPPAKGVTPRRFELGEFDGTAKVAVMDVVPGAYQLTLWADGKVPGVFEKPAVVEVVSGKSVEVAAKFGPATTITGKVTDKDGKGVAKVQVSVNVSDAADGPQPHTFLHAETLADGTFKVHGPAGWYAVWTQTPLPDGYAPPAPLGSRRRQVESAKVELGKAHAFAPIVLPKAATFAGTVTLSDGKPAAGASVSAGLTIEFRRDKIVTDKDGKFAIRNLPPDDAIAPRIKLGTAVNVPETFDLEKHEGPAAIELSEANGATFKGRVTDARGKPIASAKVGLRHQVQGVGRNASLSTFGSTATTTTDADGRYTFVGYWPKDLYRATATAEGYSEAESKQLRAEAGQTHDLGDVKLARASLSVSGVVVGSDGKPVPAAEVFGNDGPERVATTSAADGSFTLTGFGEGGGFVFVKKSGFRLVAVPVMPSDGKRVTITLSKLDAPVPPFVVPAEHRAAVDALTRHVLSLVWQTHPTFGYGGNALGGMAKIDPATAKKWRDEEKARTAGKTDYTHLINRADREKTLFDTAKTDPDEALAVVAGLKASDGFAEAVRMTELFLPTDKPKALRFAEEAVVKARQRDLPDRIWALAEAADLALRAGGAGGKKVLDEAAELAAKLTPDENGRNSLAIGLAAARVAPHDAAKADALLSVLKDPSDYNRYLAAGAAHVARTDLPRATAMLARFKPSNSYYPQEARVRVAYAVAESQPDAAVKLVDEVKEMRYRVGGYFGLAAKFAGTDKARAHKLIDAAFDLLEADPHALSSWSNYNGRAGLAATGAVRAAAIGHPDVVHLVARCLAMRSVGDAWSAEDREQRAVGLAAALAHVDPATARHLLATVAPPDEFVRRAVSQRRDWLFALALADPVRAKELADKLIERAKEARGGRNGLSETGLVELGSILTAKDRMREFGYYGSLFQDIGERD